MSLRATAPCWFSSRYPEPQKVTKGVAYPTPSLWQPSYWPTQDYLLWVPQIYVHGPEFAVMPAEPPTRSPAVPPAWPRSIQRDLHIQRKPACRPQPALGSTRKPSSVHMSAPREKQRTFHIYDPGLATAPTAAKRTLGTGSSHPCNGRELSSSSGPQMWKWLGAKSKTTAITSQRMTQRPSSQILRKPVFSKDCRDKVPVGIRLHCVSLFMEECLKFSSKQVAAEKECAEEKVAYDSSPGKNTYLTVVQNTLKNLKSLNRAALYSRLRDYLLTEDQLKVNGYPFPHPQSKGAAFLYTAVEEPKSFLRICCRCGSEYAVSSSGCCVCDEVCRYHWGRLHRRPVAGGWEPRYTCCFAALGSIGCRVARQHVRDGRKENLKGFVQTSAKPFSVDAHPGIYALDCEMCYTTHGLELTRVTVVDTEMQVIYDTFVKPDNKIVDYNTRFSGVKEVDLAFARTKLRDVQAVLLSMFSADTILIGHSLESDLLALKIIHSTVVDTSVLFPHHRGLPHKRSLRNLMASYLSQIIQDSERGHNSGEDARACMHLVLWKIQEDAKTSHDSCLPPAHFPSSFGLGPGLF